MKKQLRVVEDGAEVFSYCIEGETHNFSLNGATCLDYLHHREYFRKLLEITGEVIGDVEIVIKVGEKSAEMLLQLKEEQYHLAGILKDILFTRFPSTIEKIEIDGNQQLRIKDIFLH